MKTYSLTNVEAGVGDFTLGIDSCELAVGEIYSVVGPNGSGKSTLLNTLAFLEPPKSGSFEFMGEKISHAQPDGMIALRRRVSYLLQTPYLFNTSVKKNVGFGLRVRDLSAGAIEERVDAMMNKLSIAHLAARSAHELSGGEAQRVALARTLVLPTDVILLDEPTANVDRGNVRAVEKMIKDIAHERGATVILTTHSRNQAYRMSTNLISIIDGKIADIGYENVFSGELRENDDGTLVVDLVGGGRVVVGVGNAGRCTVAIDPEDVILSKSEIESSALNRFRGPISSVEEFGGALRVSVDVGFRLSALITRKSYLDLGLNVGQRVWTTFKANAVKVV